MCKKFKQHTLKLNKETHHNKEKQKHRLNNARTGASSVKSVMKHRLAIRTSLFAKQKYLHDFLKFTDRLTNLQINCLKHSSSPDTAHTLIIHVTHIKISP